MTSKPLTRRETQNFIDAATQTLVRKLAELDREGQRLHELRDAQFTARMAELDYRLKAIADLEQRLTERLATLRDGRDGVTLADIHPIIESEVAAAVERLRQDQQTVEPAYHWQPQRTGWPHNLPIIDVEVDSAPHPIVVARVTEAVRLLNAPIAEGVSQ